jgi:hypothetical protein
LLVGRSTSGAAALHIIQQFEGVADSDNSAMLGFRVNPPDNGLAVGPSHVFQMVNNVGRITDKLGHAVSTFNLDTFFGVDPGFRGSDPRVVYDATSDRWFAVFMNYSNAKQSSSLLLAVSTTGDPTGTFCKYHLGNPTAETFLQDYPFLGISDDKVVVAFAAFAFGTNSLLGGGYYVHNKAQVMACGDVSHVRFAPDPSSLMKPARAVSSTATAYMAAHSLTSVVVWSIDGVPGVTQVTVSTSTIPMSNSWGDPPQAVQQGSNVLLDVDRRTQTVVWQANSLWLGGNGGCVPAGDTQQRSCLRLVEVRTDTMTVGQDIVHGASGEYYFDPAVHPDGTGSLFVVFMASSASDFLGVLATRRLSTDPLSTLQPAILLRAGEAALTNVVGVEGTTSGDARVGDYSGAAVDPVDPLTIWVSSEYAKSTGDWGTYVAALSLANPAPVITLLFPSRTGVGGPSFALMVNGGSFVSSSVVLWNGSTRPTKFVSNSQLQASISATDIATGGSAQVTVVNPAPGGGTSTALTFVVDPPFSLAVTKAGVGSGTVASAPVGISCGGTCSGSFVSGTLVVLTATSDSLSRFVSWSGCDSVAGTQCTVVVTATKTVTATFQPIPLRVTVSKTGTGTGVVTSVTGISCGGVCSQVLNGGSTVTLTASPDAGSAFAGWTGAGCTGIGVCSIVLTSAKAVTATFTAPPGQFGLSVTLRGSASGVVIGSPAGISCASNCAQLYAAGMVVTLTANPTAGSAFRGWSGGGCSGTGVCVVTMNAMQSVSATFSAVYTDSDLAPNVSVVRAADIAELRSAITKLRMQNFGLGVFAFTDPTIAVGDTQVRTIHLTELRATLGDAYLQAGLDLPSYTDSTLTAGITIIKAIDLNELRSAVRTLE